MKWLGIALTTTSLLVLLIPSVASASTSEDVVVTATGYVAGVPGDFTLTYISDYEVGISWTKGPDAQNTMVRGAVGRLPEDRTDGYQVYYGDGTSTSDTGVSLDETAAPVYYRAWSQNVSGVWEEEGVSDSLEGFGMTTVAIALIVLVFSILAFWKRDAVLYMLSTIGWIFMTFYLVNRDYPEENAYLPYAIAAFCLAIVLVMGIQTVRVFFADRPRPPTQRETSRETQEEHRKKVANLTRRREKPWYDM